MEEFEQMITAKDHSSGLLFDMWEHIGPKRRKLLDRSWAGVFRKYLLHELPVERIAGAFTLYTGRPSKELYAMVGTLILQQMHDLSDEETQRALAFNLDWQYALDITDDSDAGTYVSERTIRNYRRIILEKDLAPVLFGSLTDRLIKEFKVDTAKQRLDSTHIQSNMRKLGRVRLFSTTIRKFLRKLSRSHPDVFAGEVSKELADRYLAKSSDSCFSRVKPSEVSRTLGQVSTDLHDLITSFQAHDVISKLTEYQMLERVLREQCVTTGSGADATVAVKPPQKVSPDSLQNPSDSDAGYDAHKGQGYQAQLMETCQTGKRNPEIPNLITYVEVEPAHKHDSPALIPALDATARRECCPMQLTADTHYGSDDNLMKAAEKGVEVIAPVAGPAPKGNITLASFSADLKTGYILRCPGGHAPLSVRTNKKNGLIAAFHKKTCQTCPHQKDCTVKLEKKIATLRYTITALRCAYRRVWETTPEFKEAFRWRAGIEGTNSQLKFMTGAGRLRVRGMESVRLAVTLKALGINIFRCSRALATRLRSVFDDLTRFPWLKIPHHWLMITRNRPVLSLFHKMLALSFVTQFAA
jgi:transposase